jgi:hypothetical protein
MDQLIFLLIVGGVALVKWWLKQKEQQGGDLLTPKLPPTRPQQRSQPPPFRPVAGPDSEEERMRKFLDALGIPAETARPMPPQPQRTAPAQRTQQQPPQRTPPLMPRRVAPQPPPVPVLETGEGPQIKIPPVDAGREAEPVFETVTSRVSAATELPTMPEQLIRGIEPQFASGTEKNPVAQPQPSTSFEWLRSPSEIRRAIVLREILGQPRALQPYTGGPL